MLFHVTLKLPGRNGQATQFVIADVPDARSIPDFAEMLNSDDHVVVVEQNTDPETKRLLPGDQIILNQRDVAKVSPYRERRFG